MAATFPSLTLRCWSSAAIVCCAVLAVRCYDLTSSRLLDGFAATDALQLNDLAEARDRTSYVTKSMGGTAFASGHLAAKVDLLRSDR